MIGTEQITIPRYLKIAVDISARIASGDIQQGEKLKGRSVLSTEYNVSPETIRRAMSILSDKKVVEIALGSGIVVSSKENAIQFLKNFKDDESVAELRMKLSQMLDRRRSMDEEISSLTKQIIDLYKYKRSDLITPVEIPLPSSSPVIGKSIGALEVWHNTGATIIGVIQEKSIIISPGPYYEFVQSDKILIVGDENVIERFNAFINGIN
ncbi:TrkA C-terminal domain-containing protein [Ruminiclostridium cellobioparum]|uniref:TrkA C-terminal domain-containing protein n=1 Tax=Ruminiclostridium cellobioparum TaxID=29355 RepID=UPI0004847B9F|nr:TrkA C-terminal domain-containing protein [Ruminiclostridium cellobioparum]